jgi:hypothetical protein
VCIIKSVIFYFEGVPIESAIKCRDFTNLKTPRVVKFLYKFVGVLSVDLMTVNIFFSYVYTII